jgi:hypothetical protein
MLMRILLFYGNPEIGLGVKVQKGLGTLAGIWDKEVGFYSCE